MVELFVVGDDFERDAAIHEYAFSWWERMTHGARREANRLKIL